MARKANKKMHMMPKLSLLDRCVYWIIFLILAFLWFGSLFGYIWLCKHIAFSDEMVVAVVEHASALWALVPWITFFMITFILWLTPYQDRKPIFGLRNFKYGPPAWPKVYPVFMKNKPYVWVSEKQKQLKKRMAIILVIVLLVSLIPLPLSIFGRDCLLADGSVQRYNMFNSKTREYDSGEIDSVALKVYYHTNGKHGSGRFSVRMDISTDSGKEYVFQCKDFRDAFDGEPRNWLREMIQLKQRYAPDIIQYVGQEKLDYIVFDHELTEAETIMLYQLFGINDKC